MFRAGDFWAGLAFAALGAYIVSEARGWVYLGEDGPGAGFFPMWYGIAMLVLALVLVVGAVRKTRGRTPTQDPLNRVRPQWKGMGRALACWAALAACVALLKLAGFLISFALLSWFIVAILCRKRARVAVALSIGWAVLFWIVFSWGLDMSLPAGRFF
jgi:putative tricarboxylic transport membrane protein